jgi:hypothetical protein
MCPEQMKPGYEKLETRIDRMLKGLPELEAPATLRNRVMAAIERRAATPWYRLPWQAWRLEWRLASLALLLCAFGGLCFGGWELTKAADFEMASRALGRVFSAAALVWNVLAALGNAGCLVIRHLGTPVILGSLVLIGFGYALCLGLGTLYFRLGLARR